MKVNSGTLDSGEAISEPVPNLICGVPYVNTTRGSYALVVWAEEETRVANAPFLPIRFSSFGSFHFEDPTVALD